GKLPAGTVQRSHVRLAGGAQSVPPLGQRRGRRAEGDEIDHDGVHLRAGEDAPGELDGGVRHRLDAHDVAGVRGHDLEASPEVQRDMPEVMYRLTATE